MRALAAALLFLLLAIPARAAPVDELVDTSRVTDELPEDSREFLEDLSPLDGSARAAFGRIAAAGRERAHRALAEAVRTGCVLLIVCVLLSLADTLETGERTLEYAGFAGVAAIGAAGLSDFDSCLAMGLDSLRALCDYSKALLPALAGAAAMSGNAGASAAKYAASALFMDLLLECASSVVAPGVCALCALSIADAAVGNSTLKAVKKLLKTVCGLLLTALSMAFTGYLAVSGVIAASADAMTARLAKTAVSTALPVVGSILSDAAGTLAAAAGVLRGSIGLFGMAAVLGVCLGPFVSLGAKVLAFRLSAAVCQCVADKRFAALMEDLGTCFGMILAVNGAGALMMFVSIYSLIRTAL